MSENKPEIFICVLTAIDEWHGTIFQRKDLKLDGNFYVARNYEDAAEMVKKDIRRDYPGEKVYFDLKPVSQEFLEKILAAVRSNSSESFASGDQIQSFEIFEN